MSDETDGRSLTDDEADERYLTDVELANRYHVHRVTPWRWAQQGRFPKPVKLLPKVTRWRLSEVLAWERERGAA